ncbi:hypothetical protein [Erythrobacter sp. Dej080120_24]|uniref:hypothetical protein n=1 Tax=Erythrobacter sp. Dej080120_24 TaxID=3024837 RepID=UPI0030C7467D
MGDPKCAVRKERNHRFASSSSDRKLYFAAGFDESIAAKRREAIVRPALKLIVGNAPFGFVVSTSMIILFAPATAFLGLSLFAPVTNRYWQ